MMKSRTATLRSLRAKFTGPETCQLVIMDSRTNETYVIEINYIQGVFHGLVQDNEEVVEDKDLAKEDLEDESNSNEE